MALSQPNFFLVGAAKAGTTALHQFLRRHPEIYMSPIKEPNFFSQLNMRRDLFTRNYRNSIDFDLERYFRKSYLKKIHIADVQTWDNYIQLFREVSNESAIGEASNSYLFCPSAPSEIAQRISDPKILVILRNPIERAWSHYLMNRRLGYSVSHNFIEEFNRDSNDFPKGWGITHNYRDLGMYSPQLERYFSCFPSNRLKIIMYEEYNKNPKLALRSIFSFLGVDTAHEISLTTKANQAALPRFERLNYLLRRSRIVAALGRASPVKITSAAKKVLYSRSSLPAFCQKDKLFLQDIYREDIYKLADLLQIDLSHWFKE
jgi:hypothetical protein